ncbi:hypothetical protein NLD30_11915, partial [SCandidatus Aminicenantes bacterium Aminicenantia_JdfR_composite]|nr:hypothetical protein [SCandidatus Aminicenantes bacterium Aminicenantia_JdfR_composite]
LFQYLISQDPENSIYHVGLAETYKLKGEFEHAIVEYKRALELKKEKDLSIMNNIATLYKWIRKYKESASWLNKILEIDPAHKESLQDMENLRLRRGLHFEINSGGWEVDYTKKGYDMRLFVGKIDWIDIYIGYSKAERIFYEREELFAKFYFFPKYTTYLKLEFQDKNYDYPNNPDPDSTSYDHTPGIEIEVSHIIN